MNTTNSSEILFNNDVLVKEINDRFVRLHLPVIVFIVVLVILGLTGNPIVIYYYQCKMRTTNYSIFVTVLALYDTIACVLAMPFEIVDIVLYFTFTNAVACKAYMFISYVVACGSIFTLLLIAVDRIRSICRPFGKQLSKRLSLLILAGIFLASVLFSLPNIFLFRVVTVDVPNNLDLELKGSDCTMDAENKFYAFAVAYSLLQFILFFIISGLLITLYSIVVRKIYLHKRKFRELPSTACTSFSTVPSATEYSNKQPASTEVSEIESIPFEQSTVTVISCKDDSSDKPEMSQTKTCSKKKLCCITNANIKVTLAMTCITVVFICSFLPYLCVTVWKSVKDAHEVDLLSNSGLVAYKFAKKSFLLNCCLNPWIYGIFNSEFRHYFYRKLKIDCFTGKKK